MYFGVREDLAVEAASPMTTLSSRASPRAGQERAGEVFLPDELTGLDTRDIFLASFLGTSGHACVYSYQSALNL